MKQMNKIRWKSDIKEERKKTKKRKQKEGTNEQKTMKIRYKREERKKKKKMKVTWGNLGMNICFPCSKGFSIFIRKSLIEKEKCIWTRNILFHILKSMQSRLIWSLIMLLLG